MRDEGMKDECLNWSPEPRTLKPEPCLAHCPLCHCALSSILVRFTHPTELLDRVFRAGHGRGVDFAHPIDQAVIGHGDGVGVEGVGGDDIGPGFEERLMDGGNGPGCVIETADRCSPSDPADGQRTAFREIPPRRSRVAESWCPSPRPGSRSAGRRVVRDFRVFLV